MFKKKNLEKVKIRQATIDDINGILFVEKEAWGEKAATKEQFESRLKTFPQGVLVAIKDYDKIVGVVAVEKVNYSDIINNSSLNWYEVTDNGFIKNSHKPNGDSIYGVDLSVLPSAPCKTGTRLLENIAKLCIARNLKYGVLGGRIPDYHKFADKMSVDEYVKATVKTKNGIKPLDPEINFYKKADLKIVKIMPDYFSDSESLNYGVLLVWENPFYNKWYRWLGARIFKIG